MTLRRKRSRRSASEAVCVVVGAAEGGAEDVEGEEE